MRYATRLTLTLGAVVLAVSAVFSTALYLTHEGALLRGVDAQLLTAARFAKALLPVDYHDRLVDAHSVPPEEFDRIVDRNNRLCSDLGLQYLWSCMEVDGKTRFTSATSPGKDVTQGDHAKFFEAHRDPAAFAAVFSAMATDYSSFRNEWGRGRMVLVPYRDSRGRKYCFGASMSVDEVYARLQRTLRRTLFLTAMALLAALAATVLVARSVARPVIRLTNAAQEIAKGRLEGEAAVSGPREIRQLSQMLNEMRLAIRDRMDALRESEQRFRTLFESMTEGVALNEVVYDEAGRAVDYRLLSVNPAYERHTGLTAEKARGALASELYGTGTAPFLEEWARVAAGGPPHIFETYFAPLDRCFRVSAVSPKRGQFATVFEDITDRKRQETELQQRNDELARFTYTVSHDLRSPLVTIKAFLGYLQEDLKSGDPTRVDADVAYIRNAAHKMGTLLDELLDLSRIGRKANPPVEVSLQEIAGEAVDLVAGAIAERGVRIEVTPEPITLAGDRVRLVEVFQNLIDNAVKFMGDQRSPRIEIGVETRDGETVLFVRDNGAGIDPRHRNKLFGLFEKLDPGSPGTGMGLALVRRIVEVHGGRIWAESEGLGRGATFCLTLAGTRPGDPGGPGRQEESRDHQG